MKSVINSRFAQKGFSIIEVLLLFFSLTIVVCVLVFKIHSNTLSKHAQRTPTEPTSEITVKSTDRTEQGIPTYLTNCDASSNTCTIQINDGQMILNDYSGSQDKFYNLKTSAGEFVVNVLRENSSDSLYVKIDSSISTIVRQALNAGNAVHYSLKGKARYMM